jgi:hypothetical protein
MRDAVGRQLGSSSSRPSAGVDAVIRWQFGRTTPDGGTY